MATAKKKKEVAEPSQRRLSKKEKKVVAAKLKREDLSTYQIFRDTNGIVYLRVGYSKKGALFVVNKGFNVELVDIDALTTREDGLAFRAVPCASIQECAKRLMQPLHDQCTISQRAKEYLQHILNNKELQMAETKASARPVRANKFAPVKQHPAPKAVAGGKTASANGTGKKPAAAAASAASKGGAVKASLDGHIIIAKVKKNELREGTFCHAQLEAALKCNGKTVAEAQKLLDKAPANPNGRRIEIAYMTKQGYITTKEPRA